MKNVLKPLAKSTLISLGLKEAAADAGIKMLLDFRMTTLIVLSEEMYQGNS